MGAFTVSLVDPEQPSIPVTEANVRDVRWPELPAHMPPCRRIVSLGWLGASFCCWPPSFPHHTHRHTHSTQHTPQHHQYGTRYVVSLDNFPPNSVVSVKVFRRQVKTKKKTGTAPVCLSSCFVLLCATN